MSVRIRVMEMPQSCSECRLRHDSPSMGEPAMNCPFGCYFREWWFEKKRADNCPLEEDNPLTDKQGWTVGIPTEDGDYIVCMSDSLSTPMHVPCTVQNGKPFINMVYDTKMRTIRAYMPFTPYIR